MEFVKRTPINEPEEVKESNVAKENDGTLEVSHLCQSINHWGN